MTHLKSIRYEILFIFTLSFQKSKHLIHFRFNFNCYLHARKSMNGLKYVC